MNITNQINAALTDVRATLVELSDWAKTPDISDQVTARSRAVYQLNLAMMMIQKHRRGISQSWSSLKHQVDEEFSS